MVSLYGYKYSVYAWIARFAMHEKSVDYDWIETDPFSPEVSRDYLDIHPFGRVPALVHDDFVLYETCAITGYVDAAFPGPALQPDDARSCARMSQIISIIDNYAYWPLVRQVFAQDAFSRRLGQPVDDDAILAGMEAAPVVLKAIDGLATGGGFLVSDRLTLADIHLAPMMAYFRLSPRGKSLADRYEKLALWFQHVERRTGYKETVPPLPDPL